MRRMLSQIDVQIDRKLGGRRLCKSRLVGVRVEAFVRGGSKVAGVSIEMGGSSLKIYSVRSNQWLTVAICQQCLTSWKDEA